MRGCCACCTAWTQPGGGCASLVAACLSRSMSPEVCIVDYQVQLLPLLCGKGGQSGY